MINKLWTDINLKNYNNWYPLTGIIIETPQQYINTWPNVNDWFTTFAIRAQNDINAYLNFILSKFPFDSFKDELIKETLRDMVYVCIEHWVFNRTPIEFNIDATIQFNNGNQFSANSIPTINVWDLAPSRMKIWARLTQLKQVFLDYNEDELDIEKIDLKAFYTKKQVDELINEQKAFTLSKQMKLYDDLIDDNENEIYRGPVTNFINKGYVATNYDKETETMILDWPDEIGTLPPEALQNNPQIGDFTHAATADFAAKQQKRITTNENNIKLIENKVDINKQNIDDIKNNWFNIETSPLWKNVENKNLQLEKWYVVKWSIQYIDLPEKFSSQKITKVFIKDSIGYLEIPIKTMYFLSDPTDINSFISILLSFNTTAKKFIINIRNDIENNFICSVEQIYQYQGTNTPTEFIEAANNDYYTKQETDSLLIKKQNIEDNNLQTKEKQIVLAINENKVNIDNKVDINKFPYAFTVNALGTENPNLETNNKTIIGAINENKANIDKKQDKLKFDYYFILLSDNSIAINASAWCDRLLGSKLSRLDAELKTNNKTIIGAINEIFNIKKPIKINSKSLKTNEIEENNWDIELPNNPIPPIPCPCPKWKDVAYVFYSNNKDWITHNCLPNIKYKIWYNFSPTNSNPSSEHTFMSQEFLYSYNRQNPKIIIIVTVNNHSLKLEKGNPDKFGWDSNSFGNLWKLQELQE